MWLLDPDQVQLLERDAERRLFLTPHHLMEAAGRALADVVLRRLPAGKHAPRVVVLCGHGNNGGDGFAAARWLRDRGVRVEVLGVGDPDRLSSASARHLEALQALGGDCHWVPLAAPELIAELLRTRLAEADAAVDALVGVGITGEIRPPLQAALQTLALHRPPLVVAADLPSGLDPLGGKASEHCVRADVTVAMLAAKPGFWLGDGPAHVGEVVVADLGVPQHWLASLSPKGRVLDAAPLVPRRAETAHKHRFGHLLVVAGQSGTAGAALLTAAAASRSGAGLVTVAADGEVPAALLVTNPEVMTRPRPVATDAARALLIGKSALAAGPGLGTDDQAAALLHDLLRDTRLPVVLDADALTILAAAKHPPDASAWRHPTGQLVLTPHPAELARLLGSTTAEVEADRLRAALWVARRYNAVVIAKGARTLVMAPTGEWAIWPEPCSALAKAGSGDTLTGLVGALLAGGRPAWDAACLAVIVHALAGQVLAAGIGRWGTTAADLPGAIAAVWQRLSGAAPSGVADARLWQGRHDSTESQAE